MSEKRANAVTFKGTPLTLVGPKLKPGDKAPDFKCVTGPTATVSLADTPAKARLFSVVPSLDTGVCSIQTRTFEQKLGSLGDKVAAYTVSLDLPFAQKRFCGDERTSPRSRRSRTWGTTRSARTTACCSKGWPCRC